MNVGYICIFTILQLYGIILLLKKHRIKYNITILSKCSLRCTYEIFFVLNIDCSQYLQTTETETYYFIVQYYIFFFFFVFKTF